MIVGDLKPLEEIVAAVKDYKQVLVLGCGSCVTVCISGGERKPNSSAASSLRCSIIRVHRPGLRLAV